jgi:hypothetical protein
LKLPCETITDYPGTFLFERLSITIALDQPEEWLVFWLERLIVDFYALGQPEECFVLWLERLSITAV